MADERLTDKSALTTPADGDLLEIIDISDTSANAAGTTKKITKLNLLGTPFAGAFTDLSDVDETSLESNEGKVPMVTVDLATDPATRKINFERLPTFTDLYGGNAIITGGIVHRSLLIYNCWATNYIINGRYISIPVSADVTQAAAHATLSRIDVFAVEITAAEPPVPSIVIIEGTAAANPVKPVVNLTTQVELSFRTVLATETVDPNAVTEVIYDEDLGETAEWDLTDTPTGANMADTTDPKVGTKSITLPAYATSDILEFTKDALYTYVADESLLFYMRITTGLTPKSALQFKLRDNSTGAYYIFSAKISQLEDYGFVYSTTGWQLVQIPLSRFIANSRSQTQYDEFEITFTATPIIELDWFVIQGSVVNPSTTVSDFSDDTFRIVDNNDDEKKIAFEASGITTGNTRTITVPDHDVNLTNAPIFTTVSLTAAQIKTCSSVPIEAIADPGVGKFIYINSAIWGWTYGTTPFDAGGTFNLGQSCDLLYAISPFDSDQTSDRLREGTYALNQNFCPNSNVYVNMSGGDSTLTGDSTLKVYITYQIITE